MKTTAKQDKNVGYYSVIIVKDTASLPFVRSYNWLNLVTGIDYVPEETSPAKNSCLGCGTNQHSYGTCRLPNTTLPSSTAVALVGSQTLLFPLAQWWQL